MRYEINEYKGKNKTTIFQTNSLEEASKEWKSIVINKSHITTKFLCKELGYEVISGRYNNSDKNIALQLETPEYYNTYTFKHC